MGEVCHDYLSMPDALHRIREYRPEMRVICCLRNPYDRALSSWRFFARNGIDESTLAAQGARNPPVFDEGNYATHLKNLRSVFPQHQILVFFFEELAVDPGSVARRLYEFIGVDANFRPPSLFRRVNANAKPRSRGLARVMQFVHVQSWKGSLYLSNFVGRLKRVEKLRHLVRIALYQQPKCSLYWRDSLREFPEHVISRYEEEIVALEEILEKNLSHWRASKSPVVSAEGVQATPDPRTRNLPVANRQADVPGRLRGIVIANQSQSGSFSPDGTSTYPKTTR
jgi:hypothetical protein